VGYENESEMEGRYLLRLHAYRERNPALRRKKGGQKARSVNDLALLCSNCHRMIHAKPPWPTPAELRDLIRSQPYGQQG
jgi:5-methylcytosine-specific restriction protein A